MARKKLVVAGIVAAVLALGATPTYAVLATSLSSDGPTGVKGTTASAVFEIGDKTVRQVRYADRKTLRYTFELVNDSMLPIKVTGLASPRVMPTLFELSALTSDGGKSTFTVGAHDRRTVTLSMLMTACERLSARAGSFISEIRLHTTSLGAINRTISVTLPEEVHTGSPREISCPLATSSSRPPG